MANTEPGKRTPYFIALGLAAAILLVYWPVFRNGFVWDDLPYLVDNPDLHLGLGLPGMKFAFLSARYGTWNPLGWLSLMLDYQVFGLRPWGYHLISLAFHIANTLLLFVLLTRMTGHPWRSGFVAALFAVHPLNVESVAWIVARKHVLGVVFLMATMLAYLHYVGRPNWSRYCLVALVFALGLMANSMLVTLPIALLLLDYWPLGRLQQPNTRLGWPARTLIREKAPLFVLSGGMCVVTYWAQQEAGGMLSLPLGLRISNIPVSYTRYVGKMFWPKDLAILYPFPRHAFPVWQVVGAVLLLAAISYLVFRVRKSHPYLVVGWLWYIVALIPVIGFVKVGLQAIADRYAYVPLIGLFIMVAWGVPELARIPRLRSVTSFLPEIGQIALLVLMVCTLLQVTYWRNEITLFKHTVAVAPENPEAQNYLGVRLAMKGELEKARECFQKALEINPDYRLAHMNMGGVLLLQGKKEEAMRHLEAAKVAPMDSPPQDPPLDEATPSH